MVETHDTPPPRCTFFVLDSLPSHAAALEAGICAYGGTSGGVVAAVEAARMGRSVVLLEPGKYLGGMTSGGLSAVDIGDPRSVGGIAREYFTTLAATVGVTLAWDKAFTNDGGGGPATGGAYAIEPQHKAEEVFNEMAKEAGVMVHFDSRLASVKKEGARITEACLGIGDEMDPRWFSKHDPLPNDKRDFNTATFGGNLPGANWAWPGAGYAEREVIAKAHENYHHSLLHFLATDPRVPEMVRADMKRFGPPKDEFPDTGGWPHQIFVREARRMVSDLVLTEHHTFGRKIAPKSVGLGSYGTNVHEIRRIVKDGVVTREGKAAGGRGGAGPYAVGYDAIIPKRPECENFFVTFALSASHIAFASLRMEPVFMVTSQSAATAASLTIDEDVPVQEVDYPALRLRLKADGQVLEWQPK